MTDQKSTITAQRHSAAHLLAMATLKLFPGTQLGTGPVIDNGFYYDMKTPAPLAESDLKKIQKQVKKYTAQNLDFTREELSLDDARALFTQLDQPYKIELIDKIAATGATTVSIYRTGDDFVDLCEGPHVANTKEINAAALKITKLSGAYWQADESNDQMTRVYGILFASKEELTTYEKMLAEAKKRDHRKLGKELNLFTFSDIVGAGLPLFTPKGTIIRDAITDKIWQLQKKFGWQRVTSPHITKQALYETSGHWEKFGDELFHVRGKKSSFVMKPMNCPHHTQIFAAAPKSYKDLPIRYAENGVVYRDEQTGELGGLTRVRCITQDDGHAFVTPAQIEQEVKNIISIIKSFYTDLGMLTDGNYWVSLSLHDPKTPENYLINDDGLFLEAEKILEKVATDEHLPFKKIHGEAAFYGPKLDFQFKDALGREWQLGTVQLDFNMPKRFNLTYIVEDGTKQTPVMIHRAIAGSLERFIALMIEHTAGAFPLWLAPVQMVVIPVSDKFNDYGHTVVEKLATEGFRVELRDESETLGKRIRCAQKEKIPYMLVVGEKEKETGTIAVRSRDKGDEGVVKLEKFIQNLLIKK